MSDISDNEWLMYGLSILSFIHIIAMVVIIPFGIQSKEIGIIILGCLGISPLIVLLVNPFKTFRVLNILNIFLSLVTINFFCIIYSLIKVIFYKNIHSREEDTNKYTMDIDESGIKKIKISTKISIIYLVSYSILLSLFLIFNLEGIYSFCVNAIKVDPNAMGAEAFSNAMRSMFLLFFILGTALFAGIFSIIPFIVLYLNILYNFKALKYRRKTYFKALVKLGNLSLTFANGIAAKKVLNSTSNN